MDARETIQLALRAINNALDSDDPLDGAMPDDVYEDLQRARGACMRWLRENPPDASGGGRE